jgi:hypothetical protein
MFTQLQVQQLGRKCGIILGAIQKNHHEINYSTVFTHAISSSLELIFDVQERCMQMIEEIFTYSE